MKTITLIFGWILISIVLVSAVGLLDNYLPDISNDLTSQQKSEIADRFGSAKDILSNCRNETRGNHVCPTCDLEIGEDRIDYVCNEVCDKYTDDFGKNISDCSQVCYDIPSFKEKMTITCNFDIRKKIIVNGTWIGNYTLEQLAEKQVIRVVKGITEDKTIIPDDSAEGERRW